MDIRKRILRMVGKYGCYALLLLLAMVLQTTPGLFSLGGTKPAWLLAVAVAISIQEGEFIGALYGVLAGLLWELAAGRIIGEFSILLLMLCFGIALLFMLVLRATPLNVSLLTALAALVLCSVDFVFSYWLQGHAGVGAVYLRRMLPTALYTGLIACLCLWAVRAVSRRFALDG